MILQQGVVILLIFHLPCWGLLINSEATLLYLGQDPGVAPFSLFLQTKINLSAVSSFNM